MRDDDLTALSLGEASVLVDKREVSPLELTRACIARAEALEPALHAYFTQTFETALAKATAATEAVAAGKRRGPLHGIPIALKDLYETAGVRTTAGSPIRDQYLPEADAFVVTRLKDAGAVFLGKLNMHEWAMGATNANVFYPSPRNPWDVSRVTGGSSGGSAAALAAGYCYGALGSDTRGSIRIPASLCGVTGLKPTWGRVSLRGVVPLSWSLDHAGPMARGAADCALLLNAIAGYDPADPTSIDAPVPDYSEALSHGLRGVRIGVPRNFFFDPAIVDAEIIETVQAQRNVFEGLGATVSDVDFPDPAAYDDYGAFRAEATAYHEENLRLHAGKLSRQVRYRIETGRKLSGAHYARARYRQLEFKAALRSLFQDVDLVLTPTTPIVAPELLQPADRSIRSVVRRLLGRADAPEAVTDLSSGVLIRNTAPFNTTGTPVISIPCGFSRAGLPIGMSLAGREWDEALVLGAGHAYQQATDWHRHRPLLDV